MSRDKCLVLECLNINHSHGLCDKHLWRLKNRGDIYYEKPLFRNICFVDECDTKVVAFAMCEKHYDRWKKYGNPNTLKMPMHNHGLSKTAEYRIWSGMKARCNPNSKNGNPNHAGKGIKVCERWQNSFENFYADMGVRPSPKHTIDRIENTGNYEPSNCRWATQTVQAINTGRYKNNRTGYRGVHPEGKKWIAMIQYEHKPYRVGLYLTKEEAALAYNEAAIKYHGEDAQLNKLIE